MRRLLGLAVADEHPVGARSVLVRHPDAARIDEPEIPELPVERRVRVTITTVGCSIWPIVSRAISGGVITVTNGSSSCGVAWQ